MKELSFPPDLEWKAATLEDVPAIAEMQRACFDVDGSYIETEDEVAERFESPMVTPASDSLLGFDQDGAVAVSLWSFVIPDPEDTWKVYDDNYVHPDHRTPELVNFAVDWWMQRAIDRVQAHWSMLPITYHQHAYPKQEDHIALIESKGFTPAIYFDELRRDLTVPIPDLSIPEGMHMMPHESLGDEDALALRNGAFRDHRGSQPWTLEMWQSLKTNAFRTEASFALLDGDQPVAYTVCHAYPHDAAVRGYTEGWIMGVGTARSHRGRGLASVLICESMKVFAAEGLQYATLEVDSENPTGAAGLYGRLGFEKVRGYVDYTMTVEPEARRAEDG